MESTTTTTTTRHMMNLQPPTTTTTTTATGTGTGTGKSATTTGTEEEVTPSLNSTKSTTTTTTTTTDTTDTTTTDTTTSKDTTTTTTSLPPPLTSVGMMMMEVEQGEIEKEKEKDLPLPLPSDTKDLPLPSDTKDLNDSTDTMTLASLIPPSVTVTDIPPTITTTSPTTGGGRVTRTSSRKSAAAAAAAIGKVAGPASAASSSSNRMTRGGKGVGESKKSSSSSSSLITSTSSIPPPSPSSLVPTTTTTTTSFLPSTIVNLPPSSSSSPSSTNILIPSTIPATITTSTSTKDELPPPPPPPSGRGRVSRKRKANFPQLDDDVEKEEVEEEEFPIPSLLTFSSVPPPPPPSSSGKKDAHDVDDDVEMINGNEGTHVTTITTLPSIDVHTTTTSSSSLNPPPPSASSTSQEGSLEGHLTCDQGSTILTMSGYLPTTLSSHSSTFRVMEGDESSRGEEGVLDFIEGIERKEVGGGEGRFPSLPGELEGEIKSLIGNLPSLPPPPSLKVKIPFPLGDPSSSSSLNSSSSSSYLETSHSEGLGSANTNGGGEVGGSSSVLGLTNMGKKGGLGGQPSSFQEEGSYFDSSSSRNSGQIASPEGGNGHGRGEILPYASSASSSSSSSILQPSNVQLMYQQQQQQQRRQTQSPQLNTTWYSTSEGQQVPLFPEGLLQNRGRLQQQQQQTQQEFHQGGHHGSNGFGFSPPPPSLSVSSSPTFNPPTTINPSSLLTTQPDSQAPIKPPKAKKVKKDPVNPGDPDSGKFRFLCPYPACYRTFSTSGHLTRHTKIHSGEKSHNCPILKCPAKFSRRDNCMQHFITHKKKAISNGEKLEYKEGYGEDGALISAPGPVEELGGEGSGTAQEEVANDLTSSILPTTSKKVVRQKLRVNVGPYPPHLNNQGSRPNSAAATVPYTSVMQMNNGQPSQQHQQQQQPQQQMHQNLQRPRSAMGVGRQQQYPHPLSLGDSASFDNMLPPPPRSASAHPLIRNTQTKKKQTSGGGGGGGRSSPGQYYRQPHQLQEARPQIIYHPHPELENQHQIRAQMHSPALSVEMHPPTFVGGNGNMAGGLIGAVARRNLPSRRMSSLPEITIPQNSTSFRLNNNMNSAGNNGMYQQHHNQSPLSAPQYQFSLNNYSPQAGEGGSGVNAMNNNGMGGGMGQQQHRNSIADFTNTGLQTNPGHPQHQQQLHHIQTQNLQREAAHSYSSSLSAASSPLYSPSTPTFPHELVYGGNSQYQTHNPQQQQPLSPHFHRPASVNDFRRSIVQSQWQSHQHQQFEDQQHQRGLMMGGASSAPSSPLISYFGERQHVQQQQQQQQHGVSQSSYYNTSYQAPQSGGAGVREYEERALAGVGAIGGGGSVFFGDENEVYSGDNMTMHQLPSSSPSASLDNNLPVTVDHLKWQDQQSFNNGEQQGFN